MTPGDPLEAQYRKTENIEVHEVKDGFILYNPSSDTVHLLNHTAMVIWELCTGLHDVSEISDMVGELYNVEPQSGDILQKTIEDMAAKGLVHT